MHVPSLKQVRLALAERSLSDFIRLYWRSMDPSVYCHNWHIDRICDELQAVSAGRNRRLLITMPPRHMKSISVAVAWPAWTWLQKPGRLTGPQCRFLFASYAQSLSIRDSVRCRRLIESPLYQMDWHKRFRLTSDQNTKVRFENDAGGFRLASSVDGALTGEGGDIIVVDDPHNVREAESETVRTGTLSWWNEALSTRLNDARSGAFVIIMQRVHERDLAGHVLREGGWTHLCLPARYEPEHPFDVSGDRRSEAGELLWPERFGEREIREMEIRLGSYGAAGQLQQRPAPREGGMFEPQWFEIVRLAPADAARARYWDLAATREQAGSDPDWTAGAKVALKDGIYYIEDLRRLRGTPKEVEDSVKQTAQLDGKAVPIWIEQEPGSSGKSTIDHFARNVLVGYAFRGDRVTGSKSRRADPVSAAAEAGNVKLVEGAWNRDFLDEVQSFPNAVHDDQVDAVSGAFEKLTGARIHGPQVRRL